MTSERETHPSIEQLCDQLHSRDCELARLRAELHEARATGVAIGVLLARTPGWTEQDAAAAWDAACARLTRGGNTKALASYIVQTGKLPGEGVTAR